MSLELFTERPQTELDVRLALWNIEAYLRYQPLRDLNFAALRDRLLVLQQSRDAVFFGSGAR
jgi:hypothetical protein